MDLACRNLLSVQVPLKTGKILRLVARIRHHTLKIVAGIHREAPTLWIKGVRSIRQPKPPEPARASGAPQDKPLRFMNPRLAARRNEVILCQKQ